MSERPLDIILALTQPCSTVDIATALDCPDSTAAWILRALRDAGWAKIETDGRWTVRSPV
jgi:hypothetical protein